MAEKLRVGIVGCGLVAEGQHIPGFLRLRQAAVLQAVCDKNENLARQTAHKFGIHQAYSDLSEMLEREKLDIIDICTPPQVHLPLALQAIEHGCHVLMEKPMALKVSDCDQMIEASHQHNVKLCVVHNMLFNPPFAEAKRLVAEDAIGKFVGMRILMSDPRETMIMLKDHWIHKLPGGLISETGPHAAYLSLALLGKVAAVDVYAKNFLEHPWAPFDEFRIELEGEEAISSITVSYATNRRNLNIDILGTEAALYLDFSTVLMIRQGGKDSLGPVAFSRYITDIASQVTAGVIANGFRRITGRLRYGHAILIEAFVYSLLNGQKPPVTGEEGRETVRVMEMVVDQLGRKYASQKS